MSHPVPAAPMAYHPAARLLHWASALVILATIPVGAAMTMQGWARPVQDAMFVFHKNIGLVILVLVLLRLAVRAVHPPPPRPVGMSGLQARVAGAVHVALYVLLLVMAVSGYVRVAAGGFPLEVPDALGLPRLVPRSDALAASAKQVHATARVPLIALILAHVAAALMHGIVKRDGVFSRMWPGPER